MTSIIKNKEEEISIEKELIQNNDFLNFIRVHQKQLVFFFKKRYLISIYNKGKEKLKRFFGK